MKTFHSEDELRAHVLDRVPTLYASSRTSTVIPYERLEDRFPEIQCVGNLSSMPAEMSLLPEGHLRVKGAVSWKAAREFLRGVGRDLLAAPTEELALVLAGIATSANGERSFAFGAIRDHIHSLRMMGHDGAIRDLRADRALVDGDSDTVLAAYQKRYASYARFKNAPFPRYEKETDLMVGSEGQLGVVVEATLVTIPRPNVKFFFVAIPRWEEDLEWHLELHSLVQGWRGRILSCEFIDWNALALLPEDLRPVKEEDLIVIEIRTDDVDAFVSAIPSSLSEKIFEIQEERYQAIRAGVPRAIQEYNDREHLTKMGTDLQVPVERMQDLMVLYRECASLGIRYTLFGHFGDAHLHFNFMRDEEDIARAKLFFQEIYDYAHQWKASPFAEHGIGVLKRPFITPFYGPVQRELFAHLKATYDPHEQFFPQGFMSL